MSSLETTRFLGQAIVLCTDWRNTMISRFLSVVDGVSKIAGGVAAVMLIGIAALILAEIIMRVALNLSLDFAWEYSTYFTAIVIFCGAAYTLRTGGHVRVSLLSTSVPPRAAYAIDILCTLIAVALAALLAYAMTELALRSLIAGSKSPTIVATPLVVPQGGVAVGAIVLLLQLIARLVRLFTGQPPEDTSGQASYRVD